MAAGQQNTWLARDGPNVRFGYLHTLDRSGLSEDPRDGRIPCRKSPDGFHLICSLLKIYTAIIKTDQFDEPATFLSNTANQTVQGESELSAGLQTLTASALSRAAEI